MADFSFSDDEELKRLNAQVQENLEDFEPWDKLVRAAEAQEGGLHRNSSAGAIASTREVYDKFLARFPLFFGYWKKYADLEFAIAGTEVAEMIYERGVANIGNSVDLWANYCSFKVETSHDPEVIRELFERGAESVGLDFLAHPFWDRYIEYEERMESTERVFGILSRIIHIPLHQYARYFERYRTLASSRPITDLAPATIIAQFSQQTVAAGPKPEAEMRAKIDAYHTEIFSNTQSETTKRWTFESEIKRPYYHVTELDEQQLSNWAHYLDWEEASGDYRRIRFLYERCLVTAANYEEFWLRYARWMQGQGGDKEGETRTIYERASCTYISIAKPAVRIFWAQFEEAAGRLQVAQDIYEAILKKLPNDVDTIKSVANFHRRQYGVEAAVNALQRYIDAADTNDDTRGSLLFDQARMLDRAKGYRAARTVLENGKERVQGCRAFWESWLCWEMEMHGSVHGDVRSVWADVQNRSHLSTLDNKALSNVYLRYLQEREDSKGAMKEYLDLDGAMNGPASISKGARAEVVQMTGAPSMPPAASSTMLVASYGTPAVPVNGDPAYHATAPS